MWKITGEQCDKKENSYLTDDPHVSNHELLNTFIYKVYILNKSGTLHLNYLPFIYKMMQAR